jgi:hypothetical protein
MFTVRWKRSASNELADLWTRGDSATRQAITEATDRIDRALARDPENQGESRQPGVRVFFEFPLGVRFEIDAEHSIVRVLQVWSYRRR